MENEMKLNILVLSMASCAVLAACGGGGGEAPAAAPQPAQQPAAAAVVAQPVQTVAPAARPEPAPARIAVDVYGDSIGVMEGHHLAELAADIDVRNRSVAGRSLRDFTEAHLAEFAATSDARVTVVALGTNDAIVRPSSYSISEYESSLDAAVRTLQATGKRVVIESAPAILVDLQPAGRFAPDGADRYAAAAAGVAASTGAVLCDRRAETIDATSADLPDGVHPVPALSARLAQALAKCVRLAAR
jgi:lysophospholipase L1-like esterase